MIEDDLLSALCVYPIYFLPFFRVFSALRLKIFLPFFLYLFLTSRPFLALLAIGVFLINHINAALAADNFVALGRVGFNGSSDFHEISSHIKAISLYPLRPIYFQA